MIFSSKKIHHLAFAVRDFNSSRYSSFISLLGGQLMSSTKVELEGVLVKIIKLNNETPLIEVISPLDENSKISKFLSNKEEGFHHICYQIRDIVSEREEMLKNNISFLEGYPALGYDNKPIAFLNPKHTNGLLIELKEIP